jgi:hypothetical protein
VLAVEPIAIVVVDADRAIESAIPPAALAEDRGITPKPNAATATSAMRLKVVFVDICFLSISRLSDVPSAGFGLKMPSHMS